MILPKDKNIVILIIVKGRTPLFELKESLSHEIEMKISLLKLEECEREVLIRKGRLIKF